MKTIYELTIRVSNRLPLHLTDIISNHNEGKVKVDLDILECFILASGAIYPLTHKNVMPVHHTDTGTINVWEEKDGQKILLYSIQEKLIEELVVNEESKTELN